MKGLKIFGWVCLGLALVCLLGSYVVASNLSAYWEYEFHWKLAALIFFLAAILSLLVTRALKEIKNDLELKMIMNQ